jgi:hypothetical protein
MPGREPLIGLERAAQRHPRTVLLQSARFFRRLDFDPTAIDFGLSFCSGCNPPPASFENCGRGVQPVQARARSATHARARSPAASAQNRRRPWGFQAMDPVSPGASRSGPTGLNGIISTDIMRLIHRYCGD